MNSLFEITYNVGKFGVILIASVILIGIIFLIILTIQGIKHLIGLLVLKIKR